ncbi:glycosyltransferase [Dankookia sp. P2]|uniref:glycosyltransferase n=1 Tax=Dankookia sp. P2 TaxID=3423955 RepID=UPI003D673E35
MTVITGTLVQAAGRVVAAAAPQPPLESVAGGPAVHPFVTVVVPALNEAAYIEACLTSLVKQWPAAACEIIVMDGGSRDATVALVEAFAARHPMPEYPSIRALPNPQRIQSAAVNLAARLAAPRATILVRADAHAHYPAGFVRRCVGDLLRTGATSVVVPMANRSQPDNGLQRAIAAAQSSRLGNGGSAHRARPRSGFVDHGHHAAFDRAFFLSVGGYDESFTHNEDAELDHRAQLCRRSGLDVRRRAGDLLPAQALGRAGPAVFPPWRGPGAHAAQAPAEAAAAPDGAGRRARPLPRRAPRPAGPARLLLLALAYPLGCFAWGALHAIRQRDPWMLAAGPALVTMHLSWAAGFLRSVVLRGRPTVRIALLAPAPAGPVPAVEPGTVAIRQQETAG